MDATRHRLLGTGIAAVLQGGLVATAACAVFQAAPAAAQEQVYSFDIPAQELGDALRAFARVSLRQVTFEDEAVRGKLTQALRGTYTAEAALKLLLQGSGLEMEKGVSGLFIIQAPKAARRERARAEDAVTLEEVTVTGTRIRGGTSPSPVVTIGAEHIREEGFTDLGEVIRSIPQNFGGGQNPGVALGAETGAGGNANQNLTGGSSLNLRGLGPDATLTLLNGRRMAYGGFTQMVDISAIPIEAVERIEIVADGASAIYGSDAVGGVGNVILKRDFDGFTLGARYGTTSDGGLTTREYTATTGTTWSSGGLLATYKDASTDPIYARQREYTANHMPHPATIYPGSDVRSGLFTIHQSLGELVELRLDALRTTRDQAFNITDPRDQGGLDHLPLLQQTPSRWKAIELATGNRSELSRDEIPEGPLTPSDLPQELGEPWKLAHDTATGRVAVLSRTGDRNGLAERPYVELTMLAGGGTGQPTRCTAPPCTHRPITDMVWRPGSDEVVFTVTDPDRALGQSLYRWNVITGKVQLVVESRGEMGGGGRFRAGPCATAFDALVCIASEADRPPRLERIDLESGERRILFEPNTALDQDMKESARAHQITWTDARGKTFTGQFSPAAPALPDHDTAPPLFIVHYRCSGFLRGGVGDEWPLATLARHGIAALCINSAPTRLDAVERYENGRNAIESAVEFLASRGEADPERVGIGGLSMGADIAFWTAMHSRVPRAVSVSTPVVSPNLLFLYSLWEDVHFSRLDKYWQLGGMDDTPQRWQLLSPNFAPERLNAPVLMQMSEQEYRFSLDYSIDMVRARLADVYVFPHEPHQKFLPRHKLAVYERNLDWFRFWLQGVEEDDIRKADQYARWRAMRPHGSGLSAP